MQAFKLAKPSTALFSIKQMQNNAFQDFIAITNSLIKDAMSNNH